VRRLLALLLAVLAPALGGSPPHVHAAPPTPLRLVAYYRTGLLQDVMQQLVAEYNASHPAVVVRLEYVPFADLRRYLLVANASGELPDVAVIDNPDHAFFAEEGLLLDITDRVQRWSGNGHFFAGPWRSTFLRGRQYGVPFTNNCLALFYDKAALAAAGVRVPETWEQLRAAARRLTTPGRYGLAIGAVHSEEGTFQLLPWLLSAGADLTRLDSPASIRSLAFLRSLIVDGSMSPEVIDWTQGDAQKQFSAGRAAMMVNGPWSILQLERDAGDRDLRYGIVRIPRDARSSTPLGGENIAITRHAHVEEAWDFVQFVTSREAMERAGRRRGFLPPRTDVLGSGEGWGGDPAFRVFMDLMPDAVPRGPHPRWPELSELLQGALQEALSGAQSPRDALSEAQRRLRAQGLAAPAAPPGGTARDAP
jgi:multiple sugar transport system substrate-binding protein